MRILFILPILLFTTGCGMMRRLDSMNAQLGTVVGQLEGTNERLGSVEKAANLFPLILSQLEEANRKLANVDEAAARLVKILPPAEAPPKKE